MTYQEQQLSQKAVENGHPEILMIVDIIVSEYTGDNEKRTKNKSDTVRVLSNDFPIFAEKTIELYDMGLRYNNKDYYVYNQFNKVGIHPTPKGLKFFISTLARKSAVRIFINDGIVYANHKQLRIWTDGLFDRMELENDPMALLLGINNLDNVIAPYAMLTVMNKQGVPVASKLVIMPRNEWVSALKVKNGRMGSDVGGDYPTMMIAKTIWKRILIAVISLLSLEGVEANRVSALIESQNVEHEEEQPHPTPLPPVKDNITKAKGWLAQLPLPATVTLKERILLLKETPLSSSVIANATDEELVTHAQTIMEIYNVKQ